MNEYIIKYLDYLEVQRNYSKNTIQSYEQTLDSFKNYLDYTKKDFKKVDYNYIRKLYEYLDKKKYSKNTISKQISVLRSFYKYLAKNSIVQHNPFSLTKGPKKDKLLPKFLYYNDLEELFEAANETTILGLRDRLILELLYATGMRVGELEQVKIKDINLSENAVKILGKGNKERIVFFGEYAKEILEKYLNKREDTCPYLLINNRNTRLTTKGIQYILDKLISKTTIKTKISPHMLRHSFATHMLNEGCDILSVKELLGHESLRATQVYTHITNDRLKDVYLKSHPRNKKRID